MNLKLRFDVPMTHGLLIQKAADYTLARAKKNAINAESRFN